MTCGCGGQKQAVAIAQPEFNPFQSELEYLPGEMEQGGQPVSPLAQHSGWNVPQAARQLSLLNARQLCAARFSTRSQSPTMPRAD